MKKLLLIAFVLGVLALLAALFLSNPTEDDFGKYRAEESKKNLATIDGKSLKDGLGKAQEYLEFNSGSPVSSMSVKRDNYYLLSVFTEENLLKNTKTKYLGIFKKIIKM